MSKVRTADEALRRLEELETQITGKKVDPSAEAKKQAAAYNAAFWETMHTGMPQNSLKEGSDGAGGYLVPDTFDEQLVTALTEKNVLRKLGKTIHSTRRMEIPVSLGGDNAAWMPEGVAVTFNDAIFGKVVLDAHKLATSIRVSDELLEDSAIDLEKYISTTFAERISAAEADAFIRGTGNGMPLGLIYQAPVGVVTAEDGKISAEDLIDLQYSIKRPYRENAVWLMSYEAYSALRQIVHHNGEALWRNGLEEADPVLLLGRPVYICDYMDIVTPGAFPVMFGDFGFYWIAERGKRSIKRLVERYADRGQVAFVTSERVDAKLMLPEAIKLLKVSGTPVAEPEE